jgi:uncharacterized protein (TIGR02996 family)
VSFVHHEPDIRCTPCLGCDELIAPDELHKHGHHMWRSCCSWHPYHWWCIRPATRAIAPMDRCAECGGQLEPDEVRDAVRWGATFPSRVHNGSPHGPPPPRPAGILLVAWWRRPQIDTATFPPRDVPDLEPMPELGEIWPHMFSFVRSHFEFVHADCEHDDWREQLRTSPTDDDLREVYADHLETIGELKRAEFVRTVLRRRRSAGDRVTFLDRQLRELRAELPGTWCRDVARATAASPA